MLRSNGRRFLTRRERLLLRITRAVRSRLRLRVHLDDSGHGSIYECENALDALRPTSLWIKEAGTMRWLDREIRAGDRVADVGANIGIYTIAAAHRVGPAGRVYAFEPHKVNALSLLRNVGLSRLADRVTLFSCALSDSVGVMPFFYRSLDSASSESQLGEARIAGSDRTFEPIASEHVFSTSFDALVDARAIDPPDLIKIDVDGCELAILKGMRRLLGGDSRPRAVQVELNVGEQSKIVELLESWGWALDERHHTHRGQEFLDAGVPLEDVAHNAIFRPR